MITESEVLRCISDDKARDILSSIKDKGTASLDDLGLTRKQYYSRLHNLIICGLIQKTKNRYILTSFGKVIFDSHLVIKDTIANHYWKLKAFDAMASSGIPESQMSKIMGKLIENEKIERIL